MDAESPESSPELPSQPELEERIATLFMMLEFHKQKEVPFNMFALTKNTAMEAVEFGEYEDFAKFNLYLQKVGRSFLST